MIAGIITPGEWIADVRSGCVAVYPKDSEGDAPGCHADDDRNIHYSSKGSKFNGVCWQMDKQAVNDARLFAEAGTVTNETGLTPRQLADQRAELLAAAMKFKAYQKAFDDGDDVAGMLVYDEFCKMVGAAINKAAGECA